MRQNEINTRPQGKADRERSVAHLFSDIANKTSQAAGRALTFM